VQKGKDGVWVYDLAEALVYEVLEQMAGITTLCQSSRKMPRVKMDTVCGQINGDFHMEVQFRAEPGTFRRLASNIIGGEPEGPEEVQEYATEVFNVLCGRFVSEICSVTHTVIKFQPPQYKTAAEIVADGAGEPLSMLFFVTERKEPIEFCWSENAINQLLKRSGMQ
jgi:chemotaxis protein CheY-P-specific phosphatase CheC